MIRKWGGGFLALFFVLGALSIGIKELREALGNRAPKPMTCSPRPPCGGRREFLPC